jgi:hypothetical protein
MMEETEKDDKIEMKRGFHIGTAMCTFLLLNF